MKKLTILLAATLLLGGCESFPPKRGFMTRALLGPEQPLQPAATGSDSFRFCVARGYQPGTVNFQRCRQSIDDPPR